MTVIHFVSQDIECTNRLGAALAEFLPDGTTLALVGTLGAGKTFLVQGLAEACGVDRAEVNSPTFVLCQTYDGRRRIHHLDAYRLRDVDEFFELGVEEYFDSDALTVIEWADRVAEGLPEGYLEVSIEISGDQQRAITLTQVGPAEGRWMAALQERLGSGGSSS